MGLGWTDSVWRSLKNMSNEVAIAPKLRTTNEWTALFDQRQWSPCESWLIAITIPEQAFDGVKRYIPYIRYIRISIRCHNICCIYMYIRMQCNFIYIDINVYIFLFACFVYRSWIMLLYMLTQIPKTPYHSTILAWTQETNQYRCAMHPCHHGLGRWVSLMDPVGMKSFFSRGDWWRCGNLPVFDPFFRATLRAAHECSCRCH